MSTPTPNSTPPWTPPHCPNPNCRFHNDNRDSWRVCRRGYYVRLTPPHRIPRYQCRHCRRTFSRQTFCTTYWLKRPDLQPLILELSVGAMANRQIARALKCAPATVDLQLARLGRHCYLFQRHLLNQASPPDDIVIDGLATFEHSQYFPFELLAAVDNQSSFIEHFTDAPLRRSGGMTVVQKAKRARLEAEHGRPDPKAVEKGMREVLTVTLKEAKQATVRSDLHQAYPRSMRGLDCQIEHRQTSSLARRDRRNELFEINALDSFIRHSRADHRRETIAFAKRRQGAVDRFAVFVVWKNFVKLRWEKRCRATPAMLRGLVDRVLEVGEVLAGRLFPGRVELPPRWVEYYWGRVQTPVLGVNRRHALRYAF
jgi:transposase-like protein